MLLLYTSKLSCDSHLIPVCVILLVNPLFYKYIYYCDSSWYKHNEFSCDSSCYKHNEFFLRFRFLKCTSIIVIPLAISTMNFPVILLFYMYIYDCDSSCYKYNEFFLRFRFLTCTFIIVIPLAINTMNFPVIPLAINTMNFSCDSAFLHVHLLL